MVVSSLFLKKMVTQTLQSGQRSHHLLFNYERDNFTVLFIAAVFMRRFLMIEAMD